MICNDFCQQMTSCTCASKEDGRVWSFSDEVKSIKPLLQLLIRIAVDIAVVFLLAGALFFPGEMVRLTVIGAALAAATVAAPVAYVLGRKFLK